MINFNKNDIQTINDAIKSHSDWNHTLKKYLNCSENRLDPKKIAPDNLCDLGIWLYSKGKKNYRNFPEFQELVDCHKSFHLCASELVEKANNDPSLSEEINIGAKSQFRKLSNQIVALLMQLRRKIDNPE